MVTLPVKVMLEDKTLKIVVYFVEGYDDVAVG